MSIELKIVLSDTVSFIASELDELLVNNADSPEYQQVLKMIGAKDKQIEKLWFSAVCDTKNECGGFNIMRFLLESGFDINTRDGDYEKWTALHHAGKLKAPDTLRFLLRHGANIHLKNHDMKDVFDFVGQDEGCLSILYDYTEGHAA